MISRFHPTPAQPLANPKSLSRALLRWSIIVLVCTAFVVPFLLLKLHARDHLTKAAQCAVVERSLAKELATETDPAERRWLRSRINTYREARQEHERQADRPW